MKRLLPFSLALLLVALPIAIELSPRPIAVAQAQGSELRKAMCEICGLSGGNVSACTLCNVLIVFEFFGAWNDEAPSDLVDQTATPIVVMDPDYPAGPGARPLPSQPR